MHRVPLLVIVVAMLAAAPASAAERVTLRGTAYEFGNTKVRLKGASIRVAENPRLRTVVLPNGSWDLAVPDRAKVTPYIVARGYHTIYLQTFTTAGEDLDNVNFQTPTENVYRGLATLLDVPLDAKGDPSECAIVSTFSTANVRTSTFAEFTGYGAHGVAGATAFARPALPGVVYFNENVVPDRAQMTSSKDGGVVWTRVPTGVYTIRARHPSTRFASFVATCVPGRVVNANPPWGLYELGLPMPARVKARWRVGAGSIALRSLRVSGLPAKASISLSCEGKSCPFVTHNIRRPRGGNADFVGDALKGIGAGQKLTLWVDADAHDSTYVTWKLRAGKKPKALTRCVPLGFSRPRSHC